MPIPEHLAFEAPEALKDLKAGDDTIDAFISDVIEALGQRNTAYSELMNYAERVRRVGALNAALQIENVDVDNSMPELVMTMGRQLLDQFDQFGMYNLDGTLHHYYSGRIERSTIILTYWPA